MLRSPILIDAKFLCVPPSWSVRLCGLILLAGFLPSAGAGAELISASSSPEFTIQLSSQRETSPGSKRFHREAKEEKWTTNSTAIIVCDMWDSHHCVNAVRRATEVGPRVNKLVAELRTGGATIIHAPSGCMGAYENSPARKRVIDTKPAANIPPDIAKWCDQIPSEASAPYPVDQSAGGEDDELQEHADWAAKLAAEGRNPRAPWRKQMDAIHIDDQVDFISDAGQEIWSILENRNVKHVLLVGVHTNMCVLGRPFGLRQLASHGKQVVLMRDLTDTMYDPRQWPYVNHFTGTDLVIDHIERYVCPTATSDSVLGGQPFRFSADKRPEIALLVAEDEYRTEVSLPSFAAAHLGQDFRTRFVFGDDKDRAAIPGIQQISSADALLVSVRRRPLTPKDLDVVRDFVAAGKPVIGIRTASHAFCLRDKKPPEGLADWPEFDAQVLGGNYTNHYSNDAHPSIYPLATSPRSALANAIPSAGFVSSGSLYKVSPLLPGTTVLLEGKIDNQSPEPVAWTNIRADGGRSFVTSLGHPNDFQENQFRMLLVNGIHWACGLPSVNLATIERQRSQYETGRGKQR